MRDERRPRAADDLTAAVVDDFESSGPRREDEEETMHDEGRYDEGDFDEMEDYVEEYTEEYGEGHEEEAREAFLEGEVPSRGVLSFYDRLRARVVEAADRRAGKLGASTVRLLMLAPDVFMLLVRLTLDRDVPASSRAMIGGALAYFVLPADLLPEVLLGVGGYVDDLVLASAVLSHVFSGELEPHARRHWSGSEDLRVVLRDIATTGRALLGENLYDRLRDLMARRGVDLDAAEEGWDEEESGDPEDDYDGDFDDEVGRAGA